MHSNGMQAEVLHAADGMHVYSLFISTVAQQSTHASNHELASCSIQVLHVFAIDKRTKQ
jgi:hypothetical protein